MTRVLLAASAALLLAACAGKRPPEIPPAESKPLPVACPPAALERCQTDIPRWEPPDPNSPEAWKLILPQVVLPLGEELVACDGRVAALRACLDNLQAEGVIIWR